MVEEGSPEWFAEEQAKLAAKIAAIPPEHRAEFDRSMASLSRVIERLGDMIRTTAT